VAILILIEYGLQYFTNKKLTVLLLEWCWVSKHCCCCCWDSAASSPYCEVGS